VIRADHGEATDFTTLTRFEEILAAAAEHLTAPADGETTRAAPPTRRLASRPFPGKQKSAGRRRRLG